MRQNGFVTAPAEEGVVKDVKRNLEELHRMNAVRLELANAKALHSIAISLDQLVAVGQSILEELQMGNDVLARKVR